MKLRDVNKVKKELKAGTSVARIQKWLETRYPQDEIDKFLPKEKKKAKKKEAED